ncbi:signal peptidase I [Priestia taiwanensis]|uniref:Signal peptidase I n=1 Tax=Priestia taiwanensis TaxID=1347902 RepID=A0A917EN31_9BACI|nr:signal peptidase I [Priestia taiwanensis]MBM7362538.1 signal peptidase I [Priestia taiwanensis]GGE63031.1 signal peptidase I [Priestia taiwanensis]
MKNKVLIKIITGVFVAIIVCFMIRTHILSPIIVYGASMSPTIHDNDRIIVDKLLYKMDDVERFEIIVFKADHTHNYIKRIIGLPGDYIEYRQNELYINGVQYAEPYLDKNVIKTRDFKLEDVANQYQVPEGSLFVMGDNREVSKDSRHFGFISKEDIVGNAKFIFWPDSLVDFFP